MRIASAISMAFIMLIFISGLLGGALFLYEGCPSMETHEKAPPALQPVEVPEREDLEEPEPYHPAAMV